MQDRLSVHAVNFLGAKFRELPALCRQAGVRRVTIYTALIDEVGAKAARDILIGADLQVETVSHNFLPYGQTLDAPDIDWKKCQENFNKLIEDAKALNAASIYTFTGGHGGLKWEDAAARFRDAVAPCAAKAKALGIPLLMEPATFHYAHAHIAHSLRDLVTLTEMLDFGICLDIFACWTEAGLKETIQRAIPRTHLVQIGDYILGDSTSPGRAVPGDGRVPLKTILGWIIDAGYRGSFEAELVGPRIDKEGPQASQRAIKYIAETLSSLGA